jgi:hypothetical protein
MKVINPIQKKGVGSVFISITFKNGNLSISGVEGPMSNGDCKGSCGQIIGSLRNDDPSVWSFNEGWTPEMMQKLLEVWDCWHLNDMKAGTQKQDAFIREWKKTNRYDYTAACEALKEAGLYEDNGYKYGHSLLKEDVPQDVIDWLFGLPDSKKNYAWI